MEFSQSKYIQPINDRHDAIRTAFKALFTLRFTHIFHGVILTEDFVKGRVNPNDPSVFDQPPEKGMCARLAFNDPKVLRMIKNELNCSP